MLNTVGKSSKRGGRHPRASSAGPGADRQTAFVLSGGGSLGSIQAGMLRALYDHEIAPDLLVATSAGAVNAAFVASRPQTVETADALAEVWSHMRRSEVFPFNPVTELLGIMGTRSHLVPDGALRNLLREHIQFDRLEEAAVPLHVIATDVFTGSERRLSEGDAVEAVMASSAIPAIFPPIEWEDTELIDGGVANNAPISHAVELGATMAYVLPTGYSCALDARPRGALAMAVHAVALLTQQRLIMDVERMRDEVELIVLPPPCPIEVAPTDFSQADDLIQRAYEDGCECLRSGAGRSGSTPASMHAERLVPQVERARGGGSDA